MTLLSYDALLVLSFGGPEGEDEVIPFLENVTRGRGIPRERLAEVGEHYFHFGGVSPINEQNRQLISNIETELKQRGYDLPVYFGNRNWHPFAEDAAKQLQADGRTNVLVFATSAWGGYSACRQYDEDIARLREITPEITYTKLYQFFGKSKFINLEAKYLLDTIRDQPEEHRAVLFTAHSVPTAADDAAGGPDDANLYSRQVGEASKLIARRAHVNDYEVVWQSRSGNPATPWLEPDIVDRVRELHAEEGIKHVVAVPVGFITDHIEVIWDLDTELQAVCDELGIKLDRVPTVGLDPEFASMVVDLCERVAVKVAPENITMVTMQGCTVNGEPCKPDCCLPARRPAPSAS